MITILGDRFQNSKTAANSDSQASHDPPESHDIWTVTSALFRTLPKGSVLFITVRRERFYGSVTRKRRRSRDDTDDRDDEFRGNNQRLDNSFFGRSESDDSRSVRSLGEAVPGERLRTEFDLSDRQWTWLVSLLMFLPYPAFVYLGVVYDVDTILFVLVTLAFSLVLIVVSFYL